MKQSAVGSRQSAVEGLRCGVLGVWKGFCDLLRGLFPLSTADAPEGCDYAAELEERYSKPRRCC